MSKTARERYDEMEAIGPTSIDSTYRKRMALYIETLGDESMGMTPYQWFHYLNLPWDEKKAYSDSIINSPKK